MPCRPPFVSVFLSSVLRNFIPVRPVRPDKWKDFIVVWTDPGHADDVKLYVDRMMQKGSIRRKGCLSPRRKIG
ncbi:MAG: hypothetical protein CW342_14150 [Thermoactinomycetaceae bacterium]|nr:hypothetical protein [Thermoactinomycetaceae bacterium]